MLKSHLERKDQKRVPTYQKSLEILLSINKLNTKEIDQHLIIINKIINLCLFTILNYIYIYIK